MRPVPTTRTAVTMTRRFTTNPTATYRQPSSHRSWRGRPARFLRHNAFTAESFGTSRQSYTGSATCSSTAASRTSPTGWSPNACSITRLGPSPTA
jgi:hypothetical protein